MCTKKKFIIIFCLSFLILFFVVRSLARYSSSSVWNYYLESKGFYFTSDFLGNEKKNVNTLWDGNSVYFNIKNGSSESLVTDYDIRYSVSCEVLSDIPVMCKVNGGQSSNFTGVLSNNSRCINNVDDVSVSSFGKTECEMNGYDWENILVTRDLYFSIVPLNDFVINNVDVRITVNSISPYSKTMTGVFSLFKNAPDSGSISKTINNFLDYDELILNNSYSSRKCVMVSFDSSHRIVDFDENMSNVVLDEYGYITRFNTSINGMSNLKFNFFNKNFSNENDVDDFIISEIGC
jgi:hypothetical protein